MIAKFREMDRAIAYLCDGLETAKGEAYAHVSYYPKGTSLRRSVTVEAARLRAALKHLCSRFPEATVILEPNGKGSTNAAIQCRCHNPSHATCRCQCRSDCDRPIVSVMVRSDAEPPSEQDRHEILDALHGLVTAGTSRREKVRYASRRG